MVDNVAWNSRPSVSRATLMIVMSSCTATAPTSRMPASFSSAGSRRSAVPAPGGARVVLIGVEEIANAAAISPRTFFRYFPTKEAVVFWDEYAPLVPDLLESRPDDEPPAETFRTVIREGLDGLYRRDPERLLCRVRLSGTVPELRVRLLVEQANGVEQLATLLAHKRGARGDDLRLRVIGSSLLTAASVALDLWQKDSGKSDLLALLDQATDALAEAMSELQSSPRHRNAPANARSPRR
jgi:AcrR family transcriptional regulator